MKLSCHNLTRKFGDTTALNGVNLCLDEPKIYGLLGRNGAGKTTLLRLITNYIQPTEGTITLDEQNVWENEKAQHQIFLVTETSYFAEMNANSLIQLMSEIYPSFDKEQFLSYAKRFELDLNKNISLSPPATNRSCAQFSPYRYTHRSCSWMSRHWVWMPSTASCFTNC